MTQLANLQSPESSQGTPDGRLGGPPTRPHATSGSPSVDSSVDGSYAMSGTAPSWAPRRMDHLHAPRPDRTRLLPPHTQDYEAQAKRVA